MCLSMRANRDRFDPQHIDDFDVCGPAELLDDLLKVQLPKCGCKLKVGELEWPGAASSSTSEFLGRKKILVEGAVVTMPNEKHTTDILRMLGLEDAKPSPVPGKKLNLKDDKLLEGRVKEIYASCVGSATYLSQDRPDIKFACKELAKRIRNPRECDMQNLKTLGRYLRGTMHVGHVTKMSEDFEPAAGIPLQGYCDSDWAGAPNNHLALRPVGLGPGPRWEKGCAVCGNLLCVRG